MDYRGRFVTKITEGARNNDLREIQKRGHTGKSARISNLHNVLLGYGPFR